MAKKRIDGGVKARVHKEFTKNGRDTVADMKKHKNGGISVRIVNERGVYQPRTIVFAPKM